MRFAVESWAPDYGASLDAGALEPTGAAVECGVERAVGEWEPIAPGAEGGGEDVSFVDGVLRVDAQVWIECADGRTRAGLCASYAAGVVRCDGRARLVEAVVRRGMFSAAVADAEPIRTPHGEYPVRGGAGEGPEELREALQQRMSELEVEVAQRAPREGLLVVDGPLRGRQHIPGAVGFIKSHHTSYLPAELDAVVGRLAAGERTPLFLVSDSWSRYSWYLRLPGGGGHRWAGVVRCEASADVARPEAIALADRLGATLPRFASEGHKDPRAPQNLYPIGALERQLRRRLGDPGLLLRALAAAARAPAAV